MARKREWKGKTDDSRVPDTAKLRIVDEQDGRCAICSRLFDSKEQPQFDHRKPLSMGGAHRESNLDALCKLCHSKKTAEEAAPRAKADRVRAKQILSRGFRKPAKKGSKLQWNWRLDDE